MDEAPTATNEQDRPQEEHGRGHRRYTFGGLTHCAGTERHESRHRIEKLSFAGGLRKVIRALQAFLRALR